ncbi:cytochrome c oxidase accessory protein CcoG [Rhodobium gokarnense]|uniref:Cytochrome c oxidase accessory protein FixG n=1 Tax=Rhodobium gokarnense TaxID=364296 RepID=A0ABT3H7U6_9HYPH|nr:cytochrome c oxidase accessory protein CcoG [Rhodobium gokarnense]MCW2306467.1 cytochrome c oxidase accessory protein FixG [Rhodobium gokarnense]
MRADTQGGGGGQSPLYAAAKKVYPQAVKGTFRNIRWAVLIITLGIYYLLPFVRWDRGPNAPDQAVLVDLPGRRFYFFWIEIWPQEVYYFTGLLIIAAMTLFLMNAIAGRVWCGYLCWQTVWTDLFYAVERLIEGDRRDRMKLDKNRWTGEWILEKVSKHTIWLLIAWWTGGAWVLYFADAPTLVKDLATGQAPFAAYMFIGILTFTTYVFAGFMREQVCIYMCPWPRIQAALTDEHALNVTYRYDRGEPRASVKQADKLRKAGEQVGDCIDCNQCVAVCPTGVDIRKGLQLGCIQCGLCIDACNTVMDKVGREGNLIAYDTDINIQRRMEGKEPVFKPIRARTMVYVVMIALVGALMTFTLATRSFEGLNVLHDRNPLYVQLSDGGVRNGYTIRILNKRTEERVFVLSVEGMPKGTTLQAVGITETAAGDPVIPIGPDQTRELRVLVNADSSANLGKSVPIAFRITDTGSGESVKTEDYFKGP